jgi:hypothetical protein
MKPNSRRTDIYETFLQKGEADLVRQIIDQIEGSPCSSRRRCAIF